MLVTDLEHGPYNPHLMDEGTRLKDSRLLTQDQKLKDLRFYPRLIDLQAHDPEAGITRGVAKW
jgi:hypothetical protein